MIFGRCVSPYRIHFLHLLIILISKEYPCHISDEPCELAKMFTRTSSLVRPDNAWRNRACFCFVSSADFSQEVPNDINLPLARIRNLHYVTRARSFSELRKCCPQRVASSVHMQWRWLGGRVHSPLLHAAMH